MGKYVENTVAHSSFWWIENTENQTWDGHVFQDVVTSFQLFKTQMGAFGESHCFGIFIVPGPGESVSVPISLRLCFLDDHTQCSCSHDCIHRNVCHVVPRSHSITRKWTEIGKIRTSHFSFTSFHKHSRLFFGGGTFGICPNSSNSFILGAFQSFRVFMLKKCKNVTTKKISGIPPCFFAFFGVGYMTYDKITLFFVIAAHTQHTITVAVSRNTYLQICLCVAKWLVWHELGMFAKWLCDMSYPIDSNWLWHLGSILLLQSHQLRFFGVSESKS